MEKPDLGVIWKQYKVISKATADSVKGNKLAPYGTAVDSYLLPTSKSRDTKNSDKSQKSGFDKL